MTLPLRFPCRSGAVPLCLAALAAQPLWADTTAERVAAALDAGLAEARIFLTCSALDRQSHDALVALWQTSVAETLALLADRGVAPANLEAFAASAEPEALLPGPDTRFADLRAICDANPTWRADLQARFGPVLRSAINEVFAE